MSRALASVQNGTVQLHLNVRYMSKAIKELTNATRANVTKEMETRTARSARIAELNLDTARIREQPSVTKPGIVHKVIPSPRRRAEATWIHRTL